MFENEIRELFELSMRAIDETDDYVCFSISKTNKTCNIEIMEGGFDASKNFNGSYTIYGTTDILYDFSNDQYKSAKEHILSLLEKGRCPV